MAIVLDLRYKMKLIELLFLFTHSDESYFRIDKVKTFFSRLGKRV